MHTGIITLFSLLERFMCSGDCPVATDMGGLYSHSRVVVSRYISVRSPGSGWSGGVTIKYTGSSLFAACRN